MESSANHFFHMGKKITRGSGAELSILNRIERVLVANLLAAVFASSKAVLPQGNTAIAIMKDLTRRSFPNYVVRQKSTVCEAVESKLCRRSKNGVDLSP